MNSAPQKIRIFGIRNCDTMKKTFAWFEAQGIAYDFVDYKKAGVVAAELPGWARLAGWEKLLNRKGLTWKKLPEADRDNVGEDKALALMQASPTLIKRPVVVAGENMVVGLDMDALARLVEGKA